jgi:hypothetical protein
MTNIEILDDHKYNMRHLHEDLLHPFASYPFQQTYIETLQDLQEKLMNVKKIHMNYMRNLTTSPIQSPLHIE